MIKQSKALSMSESMEHIEKEDPLSGFVKKFTSLGPDKAKELRQKIDELEMLKINEKHISKLIDILPRDKEELNKVFVDISLSEDEANKILETIKPYR